MSHQSKTSIPYNPLAPNRPEKRVGKLIVKGNDSWANVCKQGLILASIKEFDNSYADSDPSVPSAFERAVKWAEQNQDKAGNGLFG